MKPKPLLIHKFFGPSSLKGRCTSVPLPRRKLQSGLEFLLEIWPLLKRLSKEHFGRLSFENLKYLWFDNFSVFACYSVVAHEWQFLLNLTFCFYLFILFFVRFYILFDYFSFVFCISLFQFIFFTKIVIKKKHLSSEKQYGQ